MRKVRLICCIFMVIWIAASMPIPMVVIPLVGCTALFVSNELEEMKYEKQKNQRNKKVKTKKKS